MNKFAKLMTVAGTAVGLVVLFGPWTPAHAGGEKSDFALFDGTNTANLDGSGKTGALCGLAKKGSLQIGKAFEYYVTVTNFDTVDLEVRVVYLDLDFVRYKIPVGESFAFVQSAGAGEFDAAVRLVADAKISGAVSARGKSGVFCLSCDELGDGDAFCDTIIATP